jgi:NADPH-dependent glutamate synthase beta subunit-like oxidoreductase/NAD(P)H-flavin reductase
MTKLQLKYDLSFEDLYAIDGLKKIDSYFTEKLLRYSPELCNKMLDARLSKTPLFKLDESKLILELAPHLEDFLVDLFNISEAVDEYKNQDNRLDGIYRCNRGFIQKHVMNLDRDLKEIETNIKGIKAALMMYGIILPCDPHDVLEAEMDMSDTFLKVFEQSESQDAEWASYHKEILTHIENYSLWVINSFEGKKLHSGGALFRVPMKLDYEALVPDLRSYSNFSQEEVVSTRNGEMLAWIMLSANFKVPTLLEMLRFYELLGLLRDVNTVLTIKRTSICKLIFTTSCITPSRTFACRYRNYYYHKYFVFRADVKFKSTVSTEYRYLGMPQNHLRNRNGFELNDDETTPVQALHESNYCLYCHNRAKDSCSHGMKKPDGYQENPLGIKLHGCPLNQKISEMHYLKTSHNIIGALATIVIDNPMVAATGHRICNDCMKGCIFQKQTPVDTPSVESKILKDVLHLPFGFEIYSLLTRWNPLNFRNPLPKEISDHKVLVVGMGPAGFTLAHYLLNSGVQVVGVDGLKMEPIQNAFSGVIDDDGRGHFKPIEDIKNLFERLESRKPKGFGGVMEYGITVRWNKNMLDVIRLLLLRRENFRMYDGLRFGSNLTYDFCNKFDHIALSVGAGSPNIPNIKNCLTKGVRMSSDFLMSLQSGGAFRIRSIVPFQLRMPIVVIGAGLTAIDSATEALQYYLVQIRKFLHQYGVLGEKFIATLNDEDKAIATEFIAHARQLKKHPKKVQRLLEKWGGVTIFYRKRLQDSPAYKINHEELSKAFEEGIKFVENAVPQEIIDDEFGHCKEVLFKIDGKDTIVPAKAVIIATGTKPNTMLAREDSGLLQSSKVSYFGDADQKYNGSVVKAMASAKDGYKRILQLIQNVTPAKVKLDDLISCNVKEVIRLTPNVIEVVVRAPMAAANFKPGQFFRLQKYEFNTKNIKGYKFPMEGIALTGAEVKGDCISLIVLEMGLSSKLCNTLIPGEKVVLMGPTGMPTKIPHNETLMLIGGGLGNAVLMSIGKKMREQGCKVLYFAGYKHLTDRFKVREIEEAADLVVWCCDEGLFETSRPSDTSFHGNMVEAIDAYSGEIKLSDVKKMIVIGSDKLMAAIATMRKKSKKFKCSGVASVNSPMQCMMKEICAQCIQKHKIGKEELYVYSCASQDQNIDTVDFQHLDKRLTQNSLLERTADAFFSKIKA